MYGIQDNSDTSTPSADRTAVPVQVLAHKLDLHVHVRDTFTGWNVSRITPYHIPHIPGYQC